MIITFFMIRRTTKSFTKLMYLLTNKAPEILIWLHLVDIILGEVYSLKATDKAPWSDKSVRSILVYGVTMQAFVCLTSYPPAYRKIMVTFSELKMYPHVENWS